MKICIIGGVAGGAGAATRLRRLDEEAEIILFEKGEHISYANCGLPYYIGKVIRNQDSLLVTKPELLRSRFCIDVRVRSEVVSINRDCKTLTIKDLITGEGYEESYDKVILSPGAAPKRPPMPGIELEGIFTLRNVHDTLAIDDYIKEQHAKSAVVIGGGFIGIEMAENLKERDLSVTVVEFADQVIASLDKEIANILHQHLIENGILLRLGTGVSGFEQSSIHEGHSENQSGRLQVNLSDQSAVTCDLVLLAMGVDPESKLASDCGLELGMKNSIAVNDFFETSDPSILAVGDAIQITNLVTGAEGLIPLAGPANKQGRLAAEHALFAKQTNPLGRRVQGSSVLKVFDLTAASTGLNEKQAKAQNIPYKKTYVHPQSHASYYPGATPISMKLLFTEKGKLLGAQAVGYEGVEKRIDVVATALRLGGTVYDLEQLELCYAPPFSSAKDPVNMLGFTAANILKGDMPVFYAEDLPALDLTKNTLLDVSTADEMLMGTLPGAINIPLDELRDRLDELDQKKPIYVSCRVGLRGYIACRILLQKGFTAYNLSGGYRTYTHVFYQLPKAPTLLPPQDA